VNTFEARLTAPRGRSVIAHRLLPLVYTATLTAQWFSGSAGPLRRAKA
jgi:hypothetical protein